MSSNFNEEIISILYQLKNKEYNFDDIKKFLDYEDEFWEFIETRKVVIDHYDCENPNDNMIFYGVFTKPDFDTLSTTGCKVEDFRFVIPKVVDIKTAIICVHELEHCHTIYNLLGLSLNQDLDSFENSAREKEIEFIRTYKK